MWSGLQLRTRWMGGKTHPLRVAIEICCTVCALWPVSVLLCVFFARLTYPMDLEWCEGGSLYQAYRVLHGLPLYSRGDPTWAPFPYPPAHTALLALVGLLRLDFWTGRLLSIGFFGLLCWSLFREIYRHAQKGTFGIAAGALAVATIACGYPVVGQWYDLVRVDTMMMCLIIVGITRISDLKPETSWRWSQVFTIRNDLPSWNIITAAAFFAAAVYTKQTAVFFIAWACLFAIIRAPRLGLQLAGFTLLSCLLLLGLLQWKTHGGFWYWTVTNLARHDVNGERLKSGLENVRQFAPFIATIPIAAAIFAMWRVLSARSVLWVGTLLMALPASLLPYAKSGGYLNNLMPMVVLVGPVTVLLATDLANQGKRIPSFAARWGLVLGLATFIFARPLDRIDYVPSTHDRHAADALNTLVASLEGGVVVPYFAFLPARNGKTNPHWHRMVILDSQWRGKPMSEIAALDKSGARWVLLQSRDERALETYVRSHFRLAMQLPDSMRAQTITGAPAGVDELWEKVSDDGTRVPF